MILESGRIFSVGYARLRSVASLIRIADELEATILDVRSSPRSRKRGFGGRQLTESLPGLYEAHPELGGRTPITPAALDALAARAERERLILMCQEAAPGDCHRHRAIAVPLLARGVDVVHLYEDEALFASSLVEADAVDGDYPCELSGFGEEFGP